MSKSYELPPAVQARLRRLKNVFFEVRPRYSPGSPATVPMTEALRIAGNEIDAAAKAITGVYGQEQQKRVEDLGMEGIVFACWEDGHRLSRLDLLTMSELHVDAR